MSKFDSKHRLEAGNLLCVQAPGAFLCFKFHCLAFVERFVSIHHDRREVYENVFRGWRYINPKLFEALKHCTVPCSLTSTTSDAPPRIRSGSDVATALFLYGRTNTAFPKHRDSLQPAKQGCKDCLGSPSNDSKGNTRATNTSQRVPSNSPFVHAGGKYLTALRHFLSN
jgi:hypothetical protein